MTRHLFIYSFIRTALYTASRVLFIIYSNAKPLYYQFNYMPKIPTSRTKAPPVGFDKILPTLTQFEQKMRDSNIFKIVENMGHEGLRKTQAQWPVFQLHHQRNRYIYELYFINKSISKQLFDYLVKNKYVDINLINKWRKKGYEKLCCLRCVQPMDTNFGTTCVCRVPKNKIVENRFVECIHCGCKGCASGD